MLNKIEGEGWKMVEPPKKHDAESVIARLNGNAIKAGVLIERIEDNSSSFHSMYRSGCFNVEIKIDFDIGRAQVRVDRAEGYNNEN